jgi:hypothetical protein
MYINIFNFFNLGSKKDTKMKNYLLGLLGAFIIGIVFTATGNNVFRGGFNLTNFLILSGIVVVWALAWDFITTKYQKDGKSK